MAIAGLDTLLGAIVAAHETLAKTAHPGARMAGQVARIVAALDPGTARTVAAPNRVPVADRMPAILAAATGEIARTLRPVLDHVDWVRTYTEAQLGKAYLDNYGYFDLASPKRGLIRTDAIALGFLVIGPGQLYPAHNHPAVELYHVVGGTPDWQIDLGPWETKPSGSFVFHKSKAVHAMRTGATDLLALYSWLGDLETGAVLLA